MLQWITALGMLLLALNPSLALGQSVARSGNGELLVSVQDGNRLTVQRDAVTLHAIESDKAISSVAVSQSGERIYIGYADGIVEARLAHDLSWLWLGRQFDSPVTHLTPNGRELLAVDQDGAAVILRIRNGERVEVLPAHDSGGAPVDTAELSDNRVVLRSGRVSHIFSREHRRWAVTASPSRTVTTITPVPSRGDKSNVGPPPAILAAPVAVPVIAPPSFSPAPVAVPVIAEPSFSVESAPLSANSFNSVASGVAPPLPSIVAGPSFPWPAPEPSAQIDVDGWRLGLELCRRKEQGTGTGLFALTDAICDAGSARVTLGHVDWMIREALVDGGFDKEKYYHIPNGFVAVTKLEPVTVDGRRLDAEGSMEVAQGQNFFSWLLNALTSAPEGYYRFIAFALNDSLVFDTRDEAVTLAEAEEWLEGGAADLGSLHPALPQQVLEPHRQKLRILMYVFHKQNKFDAAGQITVARSEHFRNAGITAAFGLTEGEF